MQLCERCKKKAAQTYIRNAGGKEVRLHLCPDCYAELYPVGEDSFFASLLGSSVPAEKTCPACGTSFSSFRSTGLLGCAHCYTAFREELIPTIQYLQGRIRHTGKAQSTDAEGKYDMVRSLVNEREAVKLRLEEARDAKDGMRVKKLEEQLAAITRRLNWEDE